MGAGLQHSGLGDHALGELRLQTVPAPLYGTAPLQLRALRGVLPLLQFHRNFSCEVTDRRIPDRGDGLSQATRLDAPRRRPPSRTIQTRTRRRALRTRSAIVG